MKTYDNNTRFFNGDSKSQKDVDKCDSENTDTSPDNCT